MKLSRSAIENDIVHHTRYLATPIHTYLPNQRSE